MTAETLTVLLEDERALVRERTHAIRGAGVPGGLRNIRNRKLIAVSTMWDGPAPNPRLRSYWSDVRPSQRGR